MALDFIKAVENRSSGAELWHFYHPDIEQTEYPNTFVKNTVVRKLNDLYEASQRGKKVLQKEEFKVIHSYAQGDTVIIEAVWKGTLAIPVGNTPAGGEMTAYFAQFFEFRDGKIYRQRNYDCFEPF